MWSKLNPQPFSDLGLNEPGGAIQCLAGRIEFFLRAKTTIINPCRFQIKGNINSGNRNKPGYPRIVYGAAFE